MNYLKNMFVSIVAFNTLSSAQAFDLVNGTTQEFGMKFTDVQKVALPIVTKTIKANDSSDTGMSLAFTNIAGTSNWFRLYDNLHIYGVDVSQGTLLGNWPLTPSNTCVSDDIDCSEPWWLGRWGDQEFMEPEITQRIINYDQNIAGLYKFQLSYGEQEIAGEVGCLEAHPLRYGDVDGDGRNELVLFLKDTLVFFSPDIGKVTFVTLYNYSDYVPWQTLQNDTSMHLGSPNNETPQYASKAAYQQDNNGIDALRSYGKLYIQDFDGDKVADIVVWRKLYRSKLQGDTTPGFDKVRDTLLFYKKINGTYELQSDTATETIQSWLSTAKLTWSKGFPELSECAGEEGKPIPEMHDPLLNDPDVLQ